MSKSLASLFIALALLCSQAHAQVSGSVPAPTSSGSEPAVSDNYVLQARDILQFRIVGEPDYELQLRIATDGSVMLPLLNTVKIGGMTLNDARTHIYHLYNADYFVEPQIQLLLLQYAEKRVEVLGQVNRPGTVLIPPEQELTLVTAISAAGGFNRLANQRAVRVTRTLPNGERRNTTHDVQSMFRNPQNEDIPIQSGDVIFVDERRF